MKKFEFTEPVDFKIVVSLIDSLNALYFGISDNPRFTVTSFCGDLHITASLTSDLTLLYNLLSAKCSNLLFCFVSYSDLHLVVRFIH